MKLRHHPSPPRAGQKSPLVIRPPTARGTSVTLNTPSLGMPFAWRLTLSGPTSVKFMPLIGGKPPPVLRWRLAHNLVRNYRAMNRESAFTLIELLVTMAIAAILLALAIPSFRETTLNNQRASRSNEMVGALTFARGQALALRSRVIVCRTDDSSADPSVCGTGAGWEEGWVVVQDVNDDGAVDAGDTVLRRQGPLISASDILRPAAGRFTLRGNANVADQVVFDRNGITGPASTGTLAICDARGTAKGRAIVIATTGRLRATDTVASCLRS